MDTTKTLLLATTLAAISAANAQNQAPPAGAADPGQASSPHQQATVAHGSVSDAKLKMARQDGAVPATFVKKAALDGMTEVELGKAALAKSKDEKIRAFAQRMIADHGKANGELATLAKSKNLEVPKALDTEHQGMVQMLNAKSGDAFDAAYAEHMNADHAKAVALFEGASKATDGELAEFAKKTLPILEEHKEMAAKLPGTRTADRGKSSSSKY